ncbi:MAG TPA: TetR/AcrR family transcriptional regulator [Stackebrandtia sp.]|jgi:AcrR family transcriptional regulator|uniref:TetR/AcrR family transcriptional regulator n=1 Tax=Stackebrandtia sp. TaxID=2023065 RepID=UPI002D59446C|nr:TetR/AcrR family transcriptional regulator [Stackebrandtia sp.]HZE38316.1 TetR/AcrR family transcriptional regulator [Stackebrandtia sp.]
MTIREPPAEGLRERKKIATRQALSWAALRMAIDNGVDRVRVEDIAAEVGVSPRTFNNYFSNKYEAICGIVSDRAVRAKEVLLSRPGDEPLWTSIEHLVLQQYEGATEESREWSVRSRAVFEEPVLRGEYLKTTALLKRSMVEAIAERLGLDAEVDLAPHIVAGAVAASIEVALHRWRDTSPPNDLTAHLRRALAEAARGVNLPGTTREK